MENIFCIRKRNEWFVYVLICLLLSPFMLWMEGTIPQAEYIIPYLMLGICGCFFTCKRVFERYYVNISMTDISVILWFLWLLVSMLHVPKDTLDLLNQIIYFGGFMFYVFFRERISRLGVWLFVCVMILTAFLQVLFSYLLQSNNFHSTLQFKGSFFNSAFLGEYLTIGIIVLLSCLLYYPRIERGRFFNNKFQYIIVIGLIILTYTLCKVMSRASWVSLGISATFLFWPIIKKRVVGFMKYWWIFLLLILFIVGILYCIYAIRPNSVNGRFLIWQVSARMFLERPFMGYGFGGFRQNYMLFQKEYFDMINDSPFSRLASDNVFAFNDFLKILIEQGGVGLLLVLFLLFNLFFCHYDKKYLEEVRILRAIILAIIVFGCFSYPSEVLLFHVLMVIPIAYLANVEERKWKFSFRKYSRIVLFFSCLLWLGVSVWICHVCYFVHASWKFHVITQRFHGREEDFLKLNELYPKLHATIEYLFFYGDQLNHAGKYERAIVVFSQLGRCYPSSFQQIELGEALYVEGRERDAEIAWKNAIRMVPVLVKPYYLLAKLYCKQKRYEDAVLYGKILLEKELKVYTPEIYYMRKEIKEVLPVWERYCLINKK